MFVLFVMLVGIGCRWAFCVLKPAEPKEVQLHSKAGVQDIDTTLGRVAIYCDTGARGEICSEAVFRHTVYAVNDWSGS